MHSQMEEQMNQSSFSGAAEVNEVKDPKKTTSKEGGGDYIEFEELK